MVVRESLAILANQKANLRVRSVADQTGVLIVTTRLVILYGHRIPQPVHQLLVGYEVNLW